MDSSPSTNLPLEKASADNGCLDACRKCESVSCCGKGGGVHAPFLTSRDLSEIGRFTGLTPDEYSDMTTNPATGNKVRFLKANSTDGCHFLKGGKCTIHEFRPIDCRLFPLDLKKIDGKFQWVIYGYHHCVLSERDREVLLSQIASSAGHLGAEMDDYATVPTHGMEKIGFRVLTDCQTPQP